ncbi:pirin family protein, partial [bacterium]
LWDSDIPRHVVEDGGRCEITVVAGDLHGAKAPPPPPRSWAARPESELAVWSIVLQPGAVCTLPPTTSGEVLRTLYFFAGGQLQVAEQTFSEHLAIRVDSDVALRLEAPATGTGPCEVLVLQGRPIGEPVAQHGPFVMNTRDEIQTALRDYQATRFGGWPHASDGPVHGALGERFAERSRGATRERPRE